MFVGTIRRVLLLSFVVFTIHAIGTTEARAQNFQTAPTIFDVRRSLPLDPDEEVTHDYYINAGPELGLKKGSYISVVRPVPVHDPIQNKQQATLNIPIGKLQIIHVEKNIAVGRLQSELTDEDRPTVEFEAIMIGDRVDLASISSEAPAVKKKKVRLAPKTAQNEEPEQAPEAVEKPETADQQQPANPPAVKEQAPPSPPKTSAEGTVPAGPPLVKKPFPVAGAPDMYQLEQLESDFY